MPDIDEVDKAEFRDAIETVIRNYVVKSELCAMPVTEDWALVVTINDLDDDDNGKWLYMRGDKQSTHRTAGLLLMASDSLRGISKDDD